MAKQGKKFKAAADQVESQIYSIGEAVLLTKKMAFTKFDESLDLALRLGVDPKRADQNVRGTVVLPHGTGRSVRVLVVAVGEKVREAEAAGADFVGGQDMVEKIQGGWLDFDAVVATPDVMKDMGRLGRVLGPRGLMPNPKAGTVTFDVGKAVRDLKAGKVEFRVDKTGIIHCSVGRLGFEPEKLVANCGALIHAVLRAKPPTSKGRYVRSAYISSTMGPSVRIDVASLETIAA
ncbi:MAG: 50S ribosomal protein L1 [Acidobacteriota bacterium]|nr:50S ribosomal protein L1 [Acidobacteriota bacterium]